ncbi:hypothetical protein CP10139811_0343 [Chlamydia ibidis]|uniref:Uncharacterized protein n=2 Tax=Chlamydia ibidis TaxID=1405396 RepID=S7J1R5_9CHLA|nr:hypothetical protein [Chlamydia ibidis]EPP34334.1 hypothetical protein CP10139811_0343 [Chlamydia ibidis]EQM62876.1 hypothetical protein H359_0412 [Chlamydia ibidis 10-1398/6]
MYAITSLLDCVTNSYSVNKLSLPELCSLKISIYFLSILFIISLISSCLLVSWFFPCLVLITNSLVLAAILCISRKIKTREIILPKNISAYESASKLSSLFTIKTKLKKKRISESCITLEDHKRRLTLCLFKGHPLTDPYLNHNHAIVLTTNSDRDQSKSIGRSLALVGRISKSSWDIIASSCSNFFPGSISSGHCAYNQSGSIGNNVLILVNPPTIETLIPEQKRKTMSRAVTFKDFSFETALLNLIMMYRKCFAICKKHQISSIQLELLGIRDIAKSQEEYETWSYGCTLALLESIRLEIDDPSSSIKHISVNDLTTIPLKETLEKMLSLKEH